ncbi:SDA1-domain-containing protein [Blyttiomyces helicus]|uniref:Protein SDA1 n=1 Tax=Blyttiomyces helicus TaxID=388810 RepID=A0A4P9WCL3_9FUNG|nr:SDA1-domain-containing protein [Blyttiomyces helicus]|eukprot:RKO88958.1 SDA1-domain-containing protein [Blyttiomyces helicus]
MGKRSRAEFLASNLPQLQNLIKRDPSSYKDEFLQQWRHYESAFTIFNLKPDHEDEKFGELITFISHVSLSYPKECTEFPQQIVSMLSAHHQTLSPELRKTMVQALVLMRNKDQISATSLLSLFFTLFRCKDKHLRSMLHKHIVNDIKNCNAKSKNNKLNKTLQNFMYTMLKDDNDIAAKKSIEVMVDLYKKNVWNDAKTVNVIAEACFSSTSKIVAPALHFFLGTDEKEKEDSDDEEGFDLTSMKHGMTINKKTKSRKNQMEKALASVKRKARAKERAETFNFSALHLLNDPQGFAEKLFSRLKNSTSNNSFRFELRLQIMNLVSRLIGVHRLMLFGFYEFLISYLKPHQREVTAVLAYAAQASHELVPPDVLAPVVQAIADNFVWNNSASEVVTAGLNGLREICTRCPLAMSESLLQSLIEDYKNHREKGPMNAARSLLGLFREVNPEMLRKQDRGKAATVNAKTFVPAKYGEVRIMDGVDGAELLDEDSDASGEGSDDDEEGDEGDDSDDEQDGEGEGEVVEEEGEDDDSESEGAEGDDTEKAAAKKDNESAEAAPSPAKKKKSNPAAEKIFTEEDHARIRELRQRREAERAAGVKTRKDIESDDSEAEGDPNIVDVSRIMSGIRRKDDYKARMEKIKEKAKKNKAFMMIVHKRSVQGKVTRSLRDKQKVLRTHARKQKKKGF